MRLKTLIVSIMAFVLLAGGAAWGADNNPQAVTISATVNAAMKLTMALDTITFPNADPDTTASIPANENGSFLVSCKYRGTNALNLKVLCNQNLTSAESNTIGLANVTWTAPSGAGYQAGTMNKDVTQTVATWAAADANGKHDGSLSFFLANDWSYKPGTYTATATYTLSAP